MKKLLLVILLPFVASAQCFCVALARNYSPQVPTLDAQYWSLLPIETRQTPALGGQVLMNYGTQWDVATIQSFFEDGFSVAGVDFKSCKPTSRFISYADPRIFSFFQF